MPFVNVECGKCKNKQEDVVIMYNNHELDYVSIPCNNCGIKGFLKRWWTEGINIDPSSFEVAGEVRNAEVSYRDPDGKKHYRKIKDWEIEKAKKGGHPV